MDMKIRKDTLSKNSKRVQDALTQLGLSLPVVELPDSTRTAKNAAQVIGCSVGQITKSLVFRTRDSGKPVMVITSGVNQVNVSTLADLVGEDIIKADAGFVRQRTGFLLAGYLRLDTWRRSRLSLIWTSSNMKQFGRQLERHMLSFV